MYLDHRIVAKLARVLARMDMSVMLLDNDGRVILPEDNKREFTLPEAIRKNPTQPLVYGGFTLIGTESESPLFLCLPGDSPDVGNCAILAAELVNIITRVDLPHADREQTYRSILREEIEGAEMEALALDQEIQLEQNRVAIIVHLGNIDTEQALDLLNNAFGENEDDCIVEMNRHTIALIKSLGDQCEYSEVEQIGLAIETTFVSETSYNVYIGIGEIKTSLDRISESFKEARRAIDVGRVYKPEAYVYVYRKLLLERFLADVPMNMKSQYNQMLFNRKTARLFNEEMLHTIEKFFENSLNLSETARQIYIHRNTLVYRLDKVQRAIGLDLRAFDDAVTFKMMLLLGKNNSDHGKRY
ncbi:MAG: helix-turn-helix domain-containing protein [Clostridia bacterium]|nr:helix-turn-helix domain-containing protein [Clostridia bacterium]